MTLTMTVNILYFAQLRETVNIAEEGLRLAGLFNTVARLK
ncbi:MAG: molybdopterin converting factor small subunit [Candidatus Endobugula sp.]|jgi:molybdopterin converting factor small subunit